MLTMRCFHPRDSSAMANSNSVIPTLLERREREVLASWTGRQISAGALRSGQIKEEELRQQSERFLRGFVQALKAGEIDDVAGAAWEPVRELLGEVSRARAVQGFTPSETATFVFSLKEPLFT